MVCLEVVEHVPDVGAFLKSCAALVRPGGLMLLSTLNRTMKAYLLAIIGAEYVLRWLPVGTHQWDRFVTPDELSRHLARGGPRRVRLRGPGLQSAGRHLVDRRRHRRIYMAQGGGGRALGRHAHDATLTSAAAWPRSGAR